MATQASTGFETGTLGNATPTNSTDFFTGGSVSGTGFSVYDDQHAHASSARSAHFSNNGDATGQVFRHRTITGNATGVFRAYYYIPTAPSAVVTLVAINTAASALIARVRMDTSGHIRVDDNVTAKKTTTGVFTGKLFFIDWLGSPNPTGGTQQFRIASGSNLDTTSYDESYTGISLTGTSATTVNEFRFDITPALTSGTFEYWIDDVAVGDTAYIGPLIPSGGIIVSPPAMQMNVLMPTVDTGDGVTFRPDPMKTTMRMAGPTVLTVHNPVTQQPPSMRMIMAMAPPAFIGSPRPDKSSIIELELNGVRTDISNYVRLDGNLVHTFGRPTPFDPPTPGTMQIVVDNADGRFTPGNPASPYAPYLKERIGFFVSYQKGSVRIPRFTGQVDAFDADLANPMQSRVTISASDRCARLGRRKMKTLVQEAVLGTPSDVCAYLPLDDSEDAGSLRNLGTPQGVLASSAGRRNPFQTVATYSGTLPPAVVRSSLFLQGSSKVGGSLSGIVGDSQIAITRSQGAPYYGPVVELPRNGAGTVEFWVQTTDQGENSAQQLTLFSVIGNDALLLIVGWDAGGVQRIKAWDSATQAYLHAAGTSPFINDGAPHHVRIEAIAGGRYATTAGTRIWVDERLALTLTAAATWASSDGNTFILGGLGSTRSRGAQTFVPNASYAFVASYVKTRSVDPAYQYARTDLRVDADDRVEELLRWAGLQAGDYLIDADASDVGAQNAAGRSALELLQDVTATTGGALYAQPDGTIRYANAATMHPWALTATVDVGTDVDIANGLVWTSEIDNKPTSVTATCDGESGSVTISAAVVDEADRQEISIATAAGSVAQLAAAASHRLNSGTARRFKRVSLNLYTTTTDLWSALGAPVIGSRIRIASLPATLLGATYEDYYIQGGTVTTGKDRNAGDYYIVDLDLDLADDPPRGAWGGLTGSSVKEYGRWAGNGLSLAAAITSGQATAVITVPTGSAALTTASGDYPLELRIGQERVTVTGVPTSGTRTNLVANPSFETNATGWSGTSTGTVPTIARTTTRFAVGAASGLVTWAAGPAFGQAVICSVTTTVGEPYSLQIRAYVPTGAPAVYAVVPGLAAGDVSTVNDSWQLLQALNFVATSTTTTVGIGLAEVATAGLTCYIDAVLVEHGSVSGAYMDTTATDGQTLAITRGVPPTVPVAHPIGEPVDIWHPLTWAI